MYYPRGGMGDCVRKFNDPLDLDFDNVYLDDQFYVIYDTKLDVKYGMSMEVLMEEYEETHGDVGWDREDEIKLGFLKDLIKKCCREEG